MNPWKKIETKLSLEISENVAALDIAMLIDKIIEQIKKVFKNIDHIQ